MREETSEESGQDVEAGGDQQSPVGAEGLHPGPGMQQALTIPAFVQAALQVRFKAKGCTPACHRLKLDRLNLDRLKLLSLCAKGVKKAPQKVCGGGVLRRLGKWHHRM